MELKLLRVVGIRWRIADLTGGHSLRHDEKSNERLKLLATNYVAVAFVMVGLLAPVVSGNIPGTLARAVTLLWLVMDTFLQIAG